ncbi:TonB-dependent receptor [Bacteroides cellulosilyticus]|uniref:TonB-dependent receptor n=1 Tax=Bacteroides cellulosilyticus TaxID=246787 RepID=UPI001C37DEAF|nr:TonB-dependent receptor [Bacteroides cellulosilyticus]MBV3637930.1 TonB-dependent receptor [Bacteroides cellulosilyticus]MBV3664364.1 TonB-dependent receptor [Bacteroides cellulosilyticus]MBV3686265.1 TonB-dependent receptor [Bacteroides cellulosilyticus]MBV3694846.1 TonB-dependent receptor [Bacteroides cellulosilyticus]MBV3708562.1 TonB-dependent receptor [Bacteroides cellulosilyticus]
MSMKLDFGKVFFLILLLVLSTMTALAGNIKGTVLDKQTKEPLTGATIQITGTAQGVVADIDGNYTLNVNDGTYTITVRYIGYKDILLNSIKVKAETLLNFEMESDAQALGEVSVVAKKNLEGERALQMERQKATLAIENLGAKEMSIKGISNVEEGVKKITGISIASAGQLIVRGLGDRYSSTTLNGLPIASPNPDNKLIPLDIFPASTVQNITVSKVYDASAFADYSGAHIDISTKENVGSDFLSISFNAGGKFNTLGKDFYRMDRDGSLFKTPSLDQKLIDMSLTDFEEYARHNRLFNTSFQVSKKTALPEFGGNIGFGKRFTLGGNEVSVLGSIGVSNDLQTMDNASIRTLEATGNTLNEFNYDSYSNELKIAALGNLGYSFRTSDHIGYTFFYARNAIDTYMRREGVDYEDHHLIGSNNVTHIYSLQNHQVNGKHHFGKQWDLNWSGSYSKTSSDEPDRRQVMFIREDDQIKLFKLNRQETMRYFGSLNEDEWVGDLTVSYRFGDNNKLQAGFTYKDKNRDYMGTRFYYNLNKLNPTITDIYDTDSFLNMENVENGSITIDRKKQPKDSYTAGNSIYAGYIATEYYPIAPLLVNLGVRYEISKQWVDYYTDGGKAERSELNKNDLFPSLNMKYQMNEKNSLRFAFSRTVTRPSFIEMAPFLYQESYGSAQIRGNADLQNGYNYNIDLRYELFEKNGDMLSITAYYKHLKAPIERVQTLSGGSAVHSFRNADNGMATGVEIEFRKEIVKDLRFGVNGSYMYTNVKLPEGGAYTNSQRALQGASPYLANADLTYSPAFSNDRQLSVALLYNLQGPRIHSVGISGLGDIKQQPVHTLNFTGSYRFNRRFAVKLQVNDLLNQDILFKQEVPTTGDKVEVERFRKGTGFEVGFSYDL